MFLNEVNEAIKDEKEMQTLKEFQDLLRKAEHIVNRIKCKAAGSHGLFVVGAEGGNGQAV